MEISLLSHVGKMYTALLNNRLTAYLESNNILVEEQNGFRKNRSTTEHIFTLTSILDERLSKNIDTFVAFIDFQKAFDWVNRDCLFLRLLENNVDRNLYNTIKSCYDNTICRVRVNDLVTDYFNYNIGVRKVIHSLPHYLCYSLIIWH